MTTKKKIAIVGARFGEVYLNAFLEEHPWIEPVALVARGSVRARRLAHAHALPLYTSVADLPDTIDGACVVVRSSIVGGEGSRIATELLERGVPVLQEHPVHPEDIRRLQERASAAGTRYRVNTFYRFTRAWQVFARAAAALADQTGSAPVFSRFTTSRQLLYSLLDGFCLTVQQAPDQVTVEHRGESGPFVRVALGWGDHESELLLQAAMDPDDPDQHSLMMHFGQLVWPSGTLTQLASFGPVIWSPALYLEGYGDDRTSLYRDAPRMGLETPPGCVLCEAPSSWTDAFELDGAHGVRRSLEALLDPARHEAEHDSPAWQLALAGLWHRVMQCAGPVTHRSHTPPVRVDVDALSRISAAETAA